MFTAIVSLSKINYYSLQFDDLSHKSSGSSLNQSQTSQFPTVKISKPETLSNENLPEPNMRRNTIAILPPSKPPRNDQKPQDEWESKLFGKQSKC